MTDPREVLTAQQLFKLERAGLTVMNANRLAALNQLQIAAKAYTANWGRSKGGMMYRSEEPEGTALPLLEALEKLEAIK